MVRSSGASLGEGEDGDWEEGFVGDRGGSTALPLGIGGTGDGDDDVRVEPSRGRNMGCEGVG